VNEQAGPVGGLPNAGRAAAPAAARRIERLTSLYAALSRTNESIFRETDRLALCRAVCEIAVIQGRLVSASIRLYDSEERMLKPFCGHGPLEGWIGERATPLDEPQARAAWVARERRHYISNDLLNDSQASGARADALRVGVRASGTFPLTVDAELAGVFSVYAGETGFFDAELTGLLDEMARNLSFAFSRLRSAQALRTSEADYRMLFDASPDAIRVMCDGRVVLVNPACVRLFGLRSAAEMIGRVTRDSIDPEHRAQAAQRIRIVIDERRAVPRIEQLLIRADGSRVLAEVVTLPVQYTGKPAALSILRDLTERKAAARRVGRLTSLYAALSRTNEAIFRESDPLALGRAVCAIAVDHGGLVAAAMRVHNRATGELEAYCYHGAGLGQIGIGPIRIDDPLRLAARAAREQSSYVSNDVANDPATNGVRAMFGAAGINAAAWMPLFIEGRLFGVFSVFSNEAGYFDAELTGLLGEMANNLSFAFAKQRNATALLGSEARYRALFDASPDAIRVVSEGRIVMVNPAAAQLLGFDSPAAMVGMPALDSVPTAHRPAGAARLRAVIEERRAAPPVEAALLRADGSSVAVEVQTLPFEYEGKPAALAIARDLSARKQSEQRVSRLSNLYAALSRTNDAIIRIADPLELCRKVCEIAVTHGHLVAASIRRYNPATRTLETYCHYGPCAGWIGITPIPLDDPGSNAARAAREGGHYVTNDLITDPTALRSRADGARLGVRASAGFALTSDGELAGVFSVFAGEPGFFDAELTGLLREMAGNISFAFAKQKSAAALAVSEERYRALFDASPDAIRVICDERVVLLNPAGVRLFGLDSAAGMVGKLVYDTIDPDYRGIAMERIRIVIDERRAVPLSEQALVRADGSRIDVEVVTLPFEYEGRPAALSIVHDLTARKAVERATLRMNAELEHRVQSRTAALKQANEDLESFSYTVAHDLRGPLRRMNGFAALLRDALGGRLEGEASVFLDRIVDGGTTMDRLIEGLLELAHLGRTELKPQDVDLAALARAAAGELREREPQRQVEFVIAQSLRVRADPRLIKGVIDNLLGNAWKFTSGHARARIEFGALQAGSLPQAEQGELGGTNPEGRLRVCYVRDDGAGFDARYADKLFGNFQRLHTQKEFTGTGIGLASVKRIIMNHGGRVWAEGAVEQGATFYFTLPVAVQPG
jgi:PAS domain S-box-containing protein